jgi:hypothetical protein
MAGSPNKRIFAGYVGQQGSGKTYQLGRRIDLARGNPRINCVFVLDRLQEFTTEADLISSNQCIYTNQIEERGGRLPRVVAVQAGLEPEAYEWVFVEAIAQGRCMIVIDEAYVFLPSGKPIEGDLQRIVFAGRHLRSLRGEDDPTHVVFATQYPRTLHPQVWSQVNEVWCSRLRGDRALSWVRDYYGRKTVDEIEKLELREWKRIDK